MQLKQEDMDDWGRKYNAAASTNISRLTDYESAVGRMHSWLVDRCASGDVKDKDGYPIGPVTFYTLNRMRQSYDKFADTKTDADGKQTIWPMSPPTGYEKRQIDAYNELRELYHNREAEPPARVGPSFFLIVALVPVAVVVVAPGNTGFQWTQIDPEWQAWTPDAFREALKHPVANDGFKLDMNAMEEADAFVLVLPWGRSAHLEYGWALGQGKHCAVLLTPCEPELMYKIGGSLCVDITELFAWLDECQDEYPDGDPSL